MHQWDVDSLQKERVFVVAHFEQSCSGRAVLLGLSIASIVQAIVVDARCACYLQKNNPRF